MKQRNPWTWVPTLYFAEGLPNVIVMTVAVVMYMQLGMTDTKIALYTSRKHNAHQASITNLIFRHKRLQCRRKLHEGSTRQRGLSEGNPNGGSDF